MRQRVKRIGLLGLALLMLPAPAGAFTSSSPWTVVVVRNSRPEKKINWAAIGAATRDLDRARAALHRAGLDARRQVHVASGYDEAARLLREAQAEYDRVVSITLDGLRYTPEYIQTDLELQKAEQRVRDLHANPKARSEDVIAAAKNALALRSRASALRKAALAADPAVSTARYALIDAWTQVQAVRQQADLAYANDPAWIAAREQYESARKAFARSGD